MNLRPLRTYSHFDSLQKVPSDYEIGTTDLHYYLGRGFEVETPIVDWYGKYQKGSKLECSDWKQFEDPRATTYAKYTSLQSAKVAFTAKLFALMEHEPSPPGTEWLTQKVQALGALRYVFHGLQMVAAYVGSMAPASKITVTCAFQAADEMRKVHVFSQELARIEGRGAALAAKATWMTHPHWQPLRQVIEELLVVYDWGEALVALNFAVKPGLDRLVENWVRIGRRREEHKFAEILGSVLEDSVWHAQWSSALKDILKRDRESNLGLIQDWEAKWCERIGPATQVIVQEWETLPWN